MITNGGPGVINDDTSFIVNGGRGATGGESGNGGNGGGGGSGYTDGSVTVVSTQQGGSTGAAKVVIRLAS